MSSSELVAWLTANRDTANPQCVADAISRLGELKSPSAVPILIDLLAFERPETERETLHISTTHDKFPAVPALSSIGEAAVPELVQTIRTKDLSPVSRKNALRALLLIYRENPTRAVNALQQDVSNAKTAAETARLRSAVNDSVISCPNSWRARCVAAVLAAAQSQSDAQTANDRATQVANAVAKVRSGKFNGYHVEMIAEGRAVEAIPDLEKQFTLTSNTLDKAKIAQVLLLLGDRKNDYWDYLAALAMPAVESDAPDPGLYDAQGKSIQGLSEDFVRWARLHNEPPDEAGTKAVYEWPGIILLLGASEDPRALPLLRRAISSPNPLIASGAADGLAQMQDKSSVPLIIARCKKARHDEAEIIAESLVYFDDPDAQAAFKAFVPADRVILLRQKRMSRRGPLNDN